MSKIISSIVDKVKNDNSAINDKRTLGDMVVDYLNYNPSDDSGKSITSLSKKRIIGSTCYIESSLRNEEIMTPVMVVINQIYLSYVLTAINFIADITFNHGRINTTIGRIAMESMLDGLIDFTADLESQFAITQEEKQEAGLEAIKPHDIDETMKHLATGVLFEVNLNSDDKPAKTHIHCQMFPVGMPTEVAEQLVKLNYPEKFWRSMAKVVAREKRFFRDVIFGISAKREHDEALKNDTNNVLSDFYVNKINKMFKYIWGIITGNKSNNVANSVVIITQDTFKKINDESSIDLSNHADMQRFFNEAYAMMFVVVDTSYDIVDIYYNGIREKSELPFRAIAKVGKSKSGVDMDELMQTIAKGAAPRF